jgi:hypothetical protein
VVVYRRGRIRNALLSSSEVKLNQYADVEHILDSMSSQQLGSIEYVLFDMDGLLSRSLYQYS